MKRKPKLINLAVCDRCHWNRKAQDATHAIRMTGLHAFVTGHREVYAIRQVKYK
jgi:hypothetical protein